MPIAPTPAMEKAKWYAVVRYDGGLFRFGPLAMMACSKIMEQCNKEGIEASCVADMGPEFDWNLARESVAPAVPQPEAKGIKMGGTKASADACMENIKQQNARRALEKLDAPPLQKLWIEHPPPWTVKVEHGRGVITDRAKCRVTGFDAETDGIYHLGIVAAVNAAAELHPPDPSIAKPGFRYYRVGDIIDDPQRNLDVLPPFRPGETIPEDKPEKPRKRKK